MVEQGVVLGADGGTARVRIDRSGACQGCAGCLLAESGDHRVAEAANPLGASPGDRVRLETRGTPPARAAALLFLAPLAAVLCGYRAGSWLCDSLGAPAAAERVGVGVAVLLFAGVVGALYLLGRRRGGLERSVVVEILRANQSQAPAP